MDSWKIHVKKIEEANVTPELQEIEERAKNIVINTMNLAKERIGIRQALEELAGTASYATADYRMSLKSIVPPIPITAEKFIIRAIKEDWNLAKDFKYCVSYKGHTSDEASKYYYFEAIFSQPTAAYPIPQAAASVFFRVEDRQTDMQKAPIMLFRIEGTHVDHDVRQVAPTTDWVLALIQQKLKFYKRLEAIRFF